MEFLKASGSNAEVEDLIQQNLEIVEVRQGRLILLLTGGFSKNYYGQWKATFPAEEWNAVSSHTVF